MLIVFYGHLSLKKNVQTFVLLSIGQRFAISLLSQKFEFRVSLPPPKKKKIDLKHEILNYALF